jgi:hypothetical protein
MQVNTLTKQLSLILKYLIFVIKLKLSYFKIYLKS